MKPRNNITGNERSAFHAFFCPFADHIYRGALIVTGNPGRAEQLQVDVYLKAFVEYLLAGYITNFKNWLAQIVRECFDDYAFQHDEMHFEAHTVYKLDSAALKKLVDCKKPARRREPLAMN
jgi:DNA-directed RNA polymerase specialized sigma24 family protein